MEWMLAFLIYFSVSQGDFIFRRESSTPFVAKVHMHGLKGQLYARALCRKG